MTHQQLISLPHISGHRIVFGNMLYLTAESGYQITKYSENTDIARFYASRTMGLPLAKDYPDTLHIITDEEAEVLTRQRNAARNSN